jgi:large subunit ribosomal protein L7A
MIDALKDAAVKVVGTKQVIRGLEAGELKMVFIARDADEPLRRKLIAACESAGIPFDSDFTLSQIGESCGIQVGAAAAGITAAGS